MHAPPSRFALAQLHVPIMTPACTCEMRACGASSDLKANRHALKRRIHRTVLSVRPASTGTGSGSSGSLCGIDPARARYVHVQTTRADFTQGRRRIVYDPKACRCVYKKRLSDRGQREEAGCVKQIGFRGKRSRAPARGASRTHRNRHPACR